MSIDIAVETNGLCHLCSCKSYFFGHITGCYVRKAIFFVKKYIIEKILDSKKFHCDFFKLLPNIVLNLIRIFAQITQEIKNEDKDVKDPRYCDVIYERFRDTGYKCKEVTLLLRYQHRCV